MHVLKKGIHFGLKSDALPSPGVNPLESSPKRQLRKVGTWKALPASNSRKGQRVELGAQGLDQEEDLVDQARICIKTNHPRGQITFRDTLWCWDKPQALRTTRLTTARIREYATTILPIVYSAPHFGGYIQMAQIPGTPKLESRNCPETVPGGVPGLRELISPDCGIGSRRGLNQSCSPRRALSNGASHSPFGGREGIDSRLLVVGSQTAGLTPGPSFAHNLGDRCPNGQCEAIFDIYASRPFQ